MNVKIRVRTTHPAACFPAAALAWGAGGCAVLREARGPPRAHRPHHAHRGAASRGARQSPVFGVRAEGATARQGAAGRATDSAGGGSAARHHIQRGCISSLRMQIGPTCSERLRGQPPRFSPRVLSPPFVLGQEELKQTGLSGSEQVWDTRGDSEISRAFPSPRPPFLPKKQRELPACLIKN